MDFNQIKELIALINQTKISEVKIEQERFKIHIRTNEYNSGVTTVTTTPVTVPAYTPPAPVPTPIVDTPAVKVEKTTDKTPPPADSSKKLVEIKSPMVGTFYRSPAPEKPVYINIGDTISKGKVVCIIEAMKLFNEIESDISGKIVKVLVDDSSPVEYDQPLFLVEVQ